MDHRDYTCPACDHSIAIKVLGGKSEGIFVLTCEGCKARLTVDLSEDEPQLVEPPQTKQGRSAYGRLPPELADREKMMKQAFEEAWGSPPPGSHLRDDLNPPPELEERPPTKTGPHLPRGTPAGPRHPGGDPWGDDPVREDPPERGYDPSPGRGHGYGPQPPGGSSWTARLRTRPSARPPSHRILLATLLLVLAGLMGLGNLYLLNILNWTETGEQTDVTVILNDMEGDRLDANDPEHGFSWVNLTLGELTWSLEPNNDSRYVLEDLKTGSYKLRVEVRGYRSQQREVIVSTNSPVGFGNTGRYTGNEFIFDLEPGTGVARTEKNPMDTAISICNPFFLIFSILTFLGAYLTYQRTSYTGALVGGLGGILALGLMGFGSLLAILAIYLIYTSREEFTRRGPSRPPWMEHPSAHDPPPGYYQRGDHAPPAYDRPDYQMPADHEPDRPHYPRYEHGPPDRQERSDHDEAEVPEAPEVDDHEK